MWFDMIEEGVKVYYLIVELTRSKSGGCQEAFKKLTAVVDVIRRECERRRSKCHVVEGFRCKYLVLNARAWLLKHVKEARYFTQAHSIRHSHVLIFFACNHKT